ncbi:YtxH domain-containing protein [Pedobacter sp. Du54]|uniref:YtxH domain-containing protein n=1 Tax=Pedobacter anseongensis TaxID=3133439 RepID=UPI0030A4AFDF
MKYGKLIEKILSRRSHQNNTQIAVALVAGLAAGAVISILLAPEKGSKMRKGIADGARNVGGSLRDSYESLKSRIVGSQEEEEPAVAPEIPHFTHQVVKKRRSDIKELISEAHHNGQNTDPAIQA